MRILCKIGIHRWRKLHDVNRDYVCTSCRISKNNIDNKKKFKLIKSKSYWSDSLNKWETEYILLKFIKWYKISLFGSKDKYTLFKSKKIITKSYEYKPELSKEEAIDMLGTNKWTYPLEPYTYK